MITATAPGKAVLCGEYAVLQGAPGIAMAVDCRAIVTVQASSGERHRLITDGYRDGDRQFRLNAEGSFEWSEPLKNAADFALFETVFGSFRNADWPPLTIAIDTRSFCDRSDGRKLGFGSSAAVTVALAAALQRFAGLTDTVPGIAFDLHRRFQGGRGSGIDIATSITGGLLDYRIGSSTSWPMRWPDGLQYRFLWSGRPADTAGKLGRLDARDPGNTHKAMRALGAAAERAADAWHGGDARQLIEVLRAYVLVLQDFSTDLGLGIFDAGHEALAELATGSGIVYKPCGAGGGDIGVALALETQAIDEFCARATGRGFRSQDVAMDTQGVLIEGEAGR